MGDPKGLEPGRAFVASTPQDAGKRQLSEGNTSWVGTGLPCS